jgi:hypothetical protein
MITEAELRAGYKEMAVDFEREKEAKEWNEHLLLDLDCNSQTQKPPSRAVFV